MIWLLGILAVLGWAAAVVCFLAVGHWVRKADEWEAIAGAWERTAVAWKTTAQESAELAEARRTTNGLLIPEGHTWTSMN